MNFFNTNAAFLRKKRGLKQADMLTELGFPRTTWSSYEKEGADASQPDIDGLIRIADYFGVTVEDLLTKDLREDVHLIETEQEGENVHRNVHGTVHPKHNNGDQKPSLPLVRDGKFRSSFAGTNFMPRVVTVDSRGNQLVAYVPVKARQGYLDGYKDPAFIEKLPTFSLPSLGQGTYRTFEVDGVEMFNTLQDKDRVIARWTPISDIKDDRVHVVITKNNGVQIKRCLNRFNEGKLVCKSDNNHRGEYPSIVVDMYDILEAWYVVERWTRFLPNPGEIYKRIVDLEADLAIMKDRMLK